MPPTPSNPTLALLNKSHPPTTASQIFTDKIQHRPILLKPSEKTPDERSRRRHLRAQKQRTLKKSKPAPLSAREKRSLQIYEVDKSQQKYAIYEPLHKMWCGYMQEILMMDDKDKADRVVVRAEGTAGRLASADYHGAQMEVVRSRCVGRVGIRGIVVKDTRGAFEIVTRGDRVKVVPKEDTVFRFEVPFPETGKADEVDEGKGDRKDVDGEEGARENGKEEKNTRPNLVFELHGDQFRYRAADRANRKWKQHFLPDI